jgi:ClpP class serine protease
VNNHAIQAVLSKNWAILPEQLEMIASIATREHEYAGNLQALEAKLGRPLGNTMKATLRDGVAVLPVEGPLFAKANMMTEFSGATSYQMLARDLTEALANPAVQGVLLNISSPGGEVEGASEMATLIRDSKKPVWAFVSGTMASAALWLGSAADKIMAADTALIGSIGVMAGYTVKDAKPGEKSYRFISSQSPYKNASPDSEAGAARIQANIDAMAQVFIDTVAQNRNKNAEDAVEWTGQGGVFIAGEAQQVGLIDGISTFESTLFALQQELASMDYSKITVASLTEARADLVAEIQAAAVAGVEQVDVEAIKAEGAAAERERITGLEALAMPGTEELVAKFKADGTQPAQAAIEILKAAKAGGATQPGAAAHLAGLKQTESGLNAPKAGSGERVAESLDDAAKAATALARKAGIDA